MKEKMEYYPHYKKFMGMKLEQSMVKTAEYQLFAERYPHIAESIRPKKRNGKIKGKTKNREEIVEISDKKTNERH